SPNPGSPKIQSYQAMATCTGVGTMPAMPGRWPTHCQINRMRTGNARPRPSRVSADDPPRAGFFIAEALNLIPLQTIDSVGRRQDDTQRRSRSVRVRPTTRNCKFWRGVRASLTGTPAPSLDLLLGFLQECGVPDRMDLAAYVLGNHTQLVESLCLPLQLLQVQHAAQLDELDGLGRDADRQARVLGV